MREHEKQARERLRQAIAERDQKQDILDIAETGVGRAVRLRDIAQADLDDAIAARNHAAVASAKKLMEPVFGDGSLAPDVMPLPVHIAQGQLDASNEALKVLTEESDSARTAVLAAETNVRRKAVEVIDAQIEVLAEKLVGHQEAVAQLRHLIYGLSYNWVQVGDVGGPWRLSEAARKALDWSEPYYIPGTDPVRGATAQWQAYLEELCNDPEAGSVSLPAKGSESA